MRNHKETAIGNADASPLVLSYTTWAERWFDALPVGNGRLGAMVYGGPVEHLSLSDVTCWAGEAAESNVRIGTLEAFQRSREALLKGDLVAGERHALGMQGCKLNYGTNLPLGNLWIDFGHRGAMLDDYRRELDLARALVFVRYRCGGVVHIREVIASHADKALVMRLGTNHPGRLDLALRLDGGNLPGIVTVTDGNILAFRGKAHETTHSDGKTGVAVYAGVKLVPTGGELEIVHDRIRLRAGNSALLILVTDTSFNGAGAGNDGPAQLARLASMGWDVLLAHHIADHQRLFHQTSLTLDSSTAQTLALPTDTRLKRYNEGEKDPALEVLLFQYGRYLLMSSSREDSPLPAHLQGAWNDGEACRIGWACDMHLDINTQMNYWPAEVTGLSSCTAPLLRWIEDVLVPSGRAVARDAYGMPGWVAHTVSNAWGYAAPGWTANWGLHPTAGAWIASQFWEHYRFSGDERFLKERALPVLREASRFFLAYLAEDPRTGELVTGPAVSPENFFRMGGGTYSMTMGPTCDSVLVRQLFHSTLEAMKVAGYDDSLQREVEAALKRLPPLKIGRHGELMEWRENFEEHIPHHRHMAHLLALFPFAEISPDATPELAQAARVTIERRTGQQDWEDTGWSRANLLLFAARLRDGAWAYQLIRGAFHNLTETNLLVVHPPLAGAKRNVYELDGNTGICAGIAEMLLQSHTGEIHLLPALPEEWARGTARGLRARGGIHVDVQWGNGALVQARLHAHASWNSTVRYRRVRVPMALTPGEAVVLDRNLEETERTRV